MILTDPSETQKEVYMLGVPCVTLRENTKWVQTLHDGWNILIGADTEKILTALNKPLPNISTAVLFSVGASRQIRDILQSSY